MCRYTHTLTKAKASLSKPSLSCGGREEASELSAVSNGVNAAGV